MLRKNYGCKEQKEGDACERGGLIMKWFWRRRNMRRGGKKVVKFVT
jgi:hypothetical protein